MTTPAKSAQQTKAPNTPPGILTPPTEGENPKKFYAHYTGDTEIWIVRRTLPELRKATNHLKRVFYSTVTLDSSGIATAKLRRFDSRGSVQRSTDDAARLMRCLTEAAERQNR